MGRRYWLSVANILSFTVAAEGAFWLFQHQLHRHPGRRKSGIPPLLALRIFHLAFMRHFTCLCQNSRMDTQKFHL